MGLSMDDLRQGAGEIGGAPEEMRCKLVDSLGRDGPQGDGIDGHPCLAHRIDGKHEGMVGCHFIVAVGPNEEEKPQVPVRRYGLNEV
ncbi:hypothetical protein ES708_12989 [subsurface metagenome]